MWFKNLQVYRLTKRFSFSAQELSDALAAQAFKPCSSQEPVGFGWIAPLPGGQDYVHSANGYLMLCAKRQEKILPAGVINEALEEKVQLLEQKEARKLTRKERQDLKEEIRFDLLPRAFSRSALVYAYIDPQAGLIVVNASSMKRAEELLTALREALGSLAVIPLTTKNIPLQSMTHWLLHAEPPAMFSFGSECELKDLGEEGGSIRCKQQDLLSDEINSHLQAGMSVSKLELNWQDRLSFILDDNLGVKRLKFADLIQEQADNEQAEDAAQQFDVDFAIMTAELAGLLKDLTEALGGDDSAGYQQRLQEQLAKANQNETRLPQGVEEL